MLLCEDMLLRDILPISHCVFAKHTTRQASGAKTVSAAGWALVPGEPGRLQACGLLGAPPISCVQGQRGFS